MIFLLPFVVAYAAETAGPDPGTRSETTKSPRCVDDVGRVEAMVRANSGKPGSLKYAVYQKEFANEDDVERVARLIYAEGLAANCADPKADPTPVIAAVIGNRIRIRHGDVRSVIFEKDQFASSLNIYGESRYRDVLCPRDPRRWAIARERAAQAIGGENLVGPKTLVHYFLQRHSPRWPEPSKFFGNLKEYLVATELKACVRAFENPKWK